METLSLRHALDRPAPEGNPLGIRSSKGERRWLTRKARVS